MIDLWKQCFGHLMVLRGLYVSLFFCAALPAQAKAPDANKLAQIMSYCVSAIASNNPNVSTKPNDVVVSSGGAGWGPDRDHAMLLSKVRKSWTCDIVAKNPRAMLQAARAMIKSIPGAEMHEQPSPTGKGRTIAANVCFNSKRIIIRANGPGNGAIGGALMSIQTRVGKTQPC